MNARQLIVTTLLGVLMIGTIVMMPARFHGGANYSASGVRQSGMVSVRSEVRAELPPDQVRDLTYN